MPTVLLENEPPPTTLKKQQQKNKKQKNNICLVLVSIQLHYGQDAATPLVCHSRWTQVQLLF